MRQIIRDKLERLDEEREKMYEAVEHLSEKELHDHSYGWSIIQVFVHLHEAEVGSVLYMRKKMQAGSRMKDYAFGNRLRMSLSKAFLQSSIKWKAPKYIAQPEGTHSLQEVQEMWAKTRDLTKTYVKEYPDELLNKAVYKHPFAGRLDLVNAIDSMTYHQRHHMHQLKRIKRKIGK